MNEIVKYDNYMNSLKFASFTVIDLDFFMALCSRLRDKGTKKILFTFHELREITGYKQTSVKKFISDLERMNEKLMKITCKLKIDSKTIMFVLFPTFITDDKEQTLTVSVNEEFSFILNELVKNFTRFDLKEFIELDSKYSKTLYRLLKQYRTTGKYEVSIKDFREKMDCPASYGNKYIMDLVIKPVLKELQNYFDDLQCTTKYASKRGRPVTGYIFTFTPENRNYGSDQGQVQLEKKSRKKDPENSFTNFHQRTYDYDALEEILLDNPTVEAPEPNQYDDELREQLKNLLGK